MCVFIKGQAHNNLLDCIVWNFEKYLHVYHYSVHGRLVHLFFVTSQFFFEWCSAVVSNAAKFVYHPHIFHTLLLLKSSIMDVSLQQAGSSEELVRRGIQARLKIASELRDVYGPQPHAV